ncbi:hypothetical protein V5799_027153 [Amblyomma americanum]|uniref:Uncharacterized protein n=1 Tax=Amblyomma americanum TaxID=6943 RepID=A0AAQ4DGJ0_AMBAM
MLLHVLVVSLVCLLPVILFYEVLATVIVTAVAMYDAAFCGPLPSLATVCAHPMTACSHLTSGECRYSNETVLTCAQHNRSLEDSLAVEDYCLTPSVLAARLEEAYLSPWMNEAAGGLCLMLAALVLRMKFQKLQTITAALLITAFVLLVEPYSSRDLILVDVVLMHAIDLFPFVDSAQLFPPEDLLTKHGAQICSKLRCAVTQRRESQTICMMPSS